MPPMEEEDVARALGPIEELVKVDAVVVEEDGRYVLDSRRLLRSVMSYRIGAVPKHVVARSVFESLGDYAAAAIRRLLRDWKVEVVVCAGDLFARNAFLADRTRRGLVRPRLAVYFPGEGAPAGVEVA
jgi:hydrogenase maturation factor HypF (carbamoyltransferase family)